MYNNVMVPLDGSELAECVLPHVEAFIKGFRIPQVVFVRVLEPVAFSSTATGPTMLEELKQRELSSTASAKAYLDQVAENLNNHGSSLRTEVLSGRVTESLVEFAGKSNIDLILIATHGRSGVTRWVRGSVADKILRLANIPVLMVRAPGTKGGI